MKQSHETDVEAQNAILLHNGGPHKSERFQWRVILNILWRRYTQTRINSVNYGLITTCTYTVMQSTYYRMAYQQRIFHSLELLGNCKNSTTDSTRKHSEGANPTKTDHACWRRELYHIGISKSGFTTAI